MSNGYIEGMDMSKFTRIAEVSSYNNNYYVNNRDLLFAWSDDDNTTEWYLVRGSAEPLYLGSSQTTDGDEYLYKRSNT